MALAGFDRKAFEEVLKQRLSPTTPIRSAEFLRGRDKKLEDIRRSLVQPGRHVFIYGERGVGKTSLAQTVAFEHHPASRAPILLGCDPGSSFYSIAKNLCDRLEGLGPGEHKKTRRRTAMLGIPSVAGVEDHEATEHGHATELRSINDAVAAVALAVKGYKLAPVVVIDEFERIKSASERMLFADFIKQIGDQMVPLKLIFCGVGSVLGELLDAHHSCYRYLTTVPLERLGYEPRLEIIDGAAGSLGIEVENTTRYRIATISDGFPHYVHLITEKLLWQVFEYQHPLKKTAAADFVAAIKEAANDVEAHLKAIYETATLKYRNDYEEVLWAVADYHELKRRSSDIFESYLRIMKKRGTTPLSREKFNGRMNQLKKPAHASVLKGNRQGWYEFSENVLRGYVRLRAEEQGISLGIDHPMLPRAVAASARD
ncbi:MAG TPA: ATP-binding protein [Alphaproteobacteria bacterium]|nr:ATP-binding protein [Alphaproteobacteria bacterium]